MTTSSIAETMLISDGMDDTAATEADVWASSNIPIAASKNPEAVDSLIAQQLSSLSPRDREKAYMDVHCVSNSVEETPGLVESSLAQLSAEILAAVDRNAYNLADSMDPTYTRDRAFRIAFLRAEQFDCKRAALRLVRHFQVKLDLFGERKLAMEITQDDLDKDDMDALYSGYAQFLPATDRAGRGIILWIAHSEQQRFSTVSKLRRAFYNGMVACRNEEGQKRGFVSVCDCFGRGTKSDMQWKLPRLSEALPIRMLALHLCYDSKLWLPIYAILKLGFNLLTRLRIRTHFGSPQECLASLQGHGIEPSSIPFRENGTVPETKVLRQRLVDLREHERLNFSRRTRIYVPSRHDVLFGKGSPVQNHVGNKKYRKLVQDGQKQYEKVRKGEKIYFAQEIVDSVVSSSGMFLKPDGEMWLSVDNETARTKVSTAFRTLRVVRKKV